MSKINQLQAAALTAPTIEAKAAVTKPVASTPVAAKVIVKNPAPTKPVVAKSVVAKPVVTKTAAVVSKTKATKIVKEKTPKLKMERDSFTMPKAEYAQFYVLKDRLVKLGQPVKKSELLRAGIMQLSAMTDAALKVAMSKVPTIKTGRPKKK
jgi:hypothetical protein